MCGMVAAYSTALESPLRAEVGKTLFRRMVGQVKAPNASYNAAVESNALRQLTEDGHVRVAALWMILAITLNSRSLLSAESARVVRGLQSLYTFSEGKGDIVQDRAQSGPPLNLKIADPKSVRWEDNSLVIQSATRIQSMGNPGRLNSAIANGTGITFEAWLQPANDKQDGPARVITLSGNTSERNFTLGQDGKKYDGRLRTNKTSTNGIPSISTPDASAVLRRTHVVYTYDGRDKARIYLNGAPTTEKSVRGNLKNWNASYPLILANEAGGERPWLGTLHLIAIYNRELTREEVAQNFRAGADVKAAERFAQSAHARLFETKIAPILAKNCLDCHDSAANKGKLDLSKKKSALAGGETGKVIVPGKSGESLLWEMIQSGDMPPEDAIPLASHEKELIRQWLDAGAAWSLDEIDPVTFAHAEGASTRFIQRLTITEYIETVRAAVGVDISAAARKILPPDLRADGFSNTAYNLTVDLKHVECYSQLAELIVEQMDVAKFSQRFSKSRSLSTDASMRDFVAAMGKWLFRGPLDEREVTNYCGVGTTVSSAGGSYEDGVSLIVEAMLQSPRFIYRLESQRGDGTEWPVSQHELATRMSYIVWGGPPDKQLMKAADEGALGDPAQLKLQVERMLKDPRAVTRSCQFISEWLHLDRLGNMQPDAKRFPQWQAELGNDMRDETIAYFKEVVWKERRPLTDLFNAQFTFASPRLAKHYGIASAPNGVSDGGLVRYDLSKVSSRGGLLTQGSVLTVGGDDASMVTRGLFVLHDILRGTVKAPPPGLDTTPVPSKPGLPQRLIAEKRIKDASCGGCHSRFEPLAFGLERYDGLGGFHEQDEHGNTLREDGEVLFPGAAQAVKYDSSMKLMEVLAQSDRVRKSITWKVAQFSLARPLGPADARLLEEVHAEAWKSGGTYESLITALVASDLVRYSRTVTD